MKMSWKYYSFAYYCTFSRMVCSEICSAQPCRNNVHWHAMFFHSVCYAHTHTIMIIILCYHAICNY